MNERDVILEIYVEINNIFFFSLSIDFFRM